MHYCKNRVLNTALKSSRKILVSFDIIRSIAWWRFVKPETFILEMQSLLGWQWFQIRAITYLRMMLWPFSLGNKRNCGKQIQIKRERNCRHSNSLKDDAIANRACTQTFAHQPKGWLPQFGNSCLDVEKSCLNVAIVALKHDAIQKTWANGWFKRWCNEIPPLTMMQLIRASKRDEINWCNLEFKKCSLI